MPRQPIIDIHTHVFPDKIAPLAVTSISDFYQIPMASPGTVSDLLAANERAGVDFSVVFSTATRLEQVESINRFMAECQQIPSLIGFGTLHPDMNTTEIHQTLEIILGNDLRGIKLHPDFQQIEADSTFMHELCRQLQGRLPILMHAGDPRYDYSHPKRIRNLALAFPDTQIIAAHFGGWSRWSEAIDSLAGLPNLYVDTSSSLPFMKMDEALQLIDAFGIDRILFGSDYPMWQPADEVLLIENLGLTVTEKRAVFWDNSAGLLGLT